MGGLRVRCECGERLATEISTRFRDAVLRDRLGLRSSLAGLEPPPLPSGNEERVASASEFVAWHDRTMRLFAESRMLLPTLHHIRRASDDGHTMPCRAYLEWNGACWFVEADDTREIVLREVERGAFEAAISTERGWRPCIPKLDETGARALVRRANGEVVMPARLFERVFAGKGFELDRANLLEYWSEEFAELTKTADHARDCGRPLHVTLG